MIAQLAIVSLGVIAVCLSQMASPRAQRFACLFGLAGQPFWFYVTWTTDQWGMFGLCFGYTWAWLMGLWQHWLRHRTPGEGAQS